MKNREIIITAEFEGFHRWPEAPEIVSFLKHQHRHLFKIRAGISVDRSNRQYEFFIEQKQLKHYLIRFQNVQMIKSCEEIADEIFDAFERYRWVEVWEDGENGARVEER